MGVAQDCLMDAVAALLLPIDDVESERGFGNTGDLINKMPALVMKEGLAVTRSPN